MAVNQTLAVRVFGGPADQEGRSSGNTSNQLQGEVIALNAGAGVSRRVKGPRKYGSFSVHMGVTEAAAGGAVTVSYSNLPDPDPTNDAHWGATDAAFAALVLTGVASFVIGKTGAPYEWIRYKAVPTGDTASIWLYHRADGSES